MKIADKNHYMFYIARNITDYRIIENFQGTVVLSVNEERIRGAIASDIGSREYLLSDDVIVSAPDPKKIGKKLSEIQDSEITSIRQQIMKSADLQSAMSSHLRITGKCPSVNGFICLSLSA